MRVNGTMMKTMSRKIMEMVRRCVIRARSKRRLDGPPATRPAKNMTSINIAERMQSENTHQLTSDGKCLNLWCGRRVGVLGSTDASCDSRAKGLMKEGAGAGGRRHGEHTITLVMTAGRTCGNRMQNALLVVSCGIGRD